MNKYYTSRKKNQQSNILRRKRLADVLKAINSESKDIPDDFNNNRIVTLRSHNIDLYKLMMKKINHGIYRIMVEQACGLGKSYLMLAFIEDNMKGKRVLYIAPKDAIAASIFNYPEYNLLINAGYEIVYKNYAQFNKIRDWMYDFDAILIDECHHLQSPKQGKNILEISYTYAANKKPVIGFTATPYIDKGRDGDLYAGSYFDDVCVGYNLIDAVNAKLYTPIKYYIANDLMRLNGNNAQSYKGSYNYLLNATSTASNILSQYDRCDKIIAYFSNIAMLEKSKSFIESNFKDYEIIELHTGSITSSDDANDIIRQFNESNAKTILLTINMTLEGIHPKRVDAIMLFRNVTRKHTFTQILTRLNSLGGVITNKIFIDMPDCFNTLYSSIENITDENDSKPIISALDQSIGCVDVIRNIERIVSNANKYNSRDLWFKHYDIEDGYRGIKDTSYSTICWENMRETYPYLTEKKSSTGYHAFIDNVTRFKSVRKAIDYMLDEYSIKMDLYEVYKDINDGDYGLEDTSSMVKCFKSMQKINRLLDDSTYLVFKHAMYDKKSVKGAVEHMLYSYKKAFSAFDQFYDIEPGCYGLEDTSSANACLDSIVKLRPDMFNNINRSAYANFMRRIKKFKSVSKTIEYYLYEKRNKAKYTDGFIQFNDIKPGDYNLEDISSRTATYNSILKLRPDLNNSASLKSLFNARITKFESVRKAVEYMLFEYKPGATKKDYAMIYCDIDPKEYGIENGINVKSCMEYLCQIRYGFEYNRRLIKGEFVNKIGEFKSLAKAIEYMAKDYKFTYEISWENNMDIISGEFGVKETASIHKYFDELCIIYPKLLSVNRSRAIFYQMISINKSDRKAVKRFIEEYC